MKTIYTLVVNQRFLIILLPQPQSIVLKSKLSFSLNLTEKNTTHFFTIKFEFMNY